MRHQLNFTKRLEYKNQRVSSDIHIFSVICDFNQDIPTVPMSGLVELHESYEKILKHLRSQGYFIPGNSTPYSRDPALDTLTECTGTRLMTYPDMDFACYTNCERSQCELFIPCDSTIR
jgi:hypothetical protein